MNLLELLLVTACVVTLIDAAIKYAHIGDYTPSNGESGQIGTGNEARDR